VPLRISESAAGALVAPRPVASQRRARSSPPRTLLGYQSADRTSSYLRDGEIPPAPSAAGGTPTSACDGGESSGSEATQGRGPGAPAALASPTLLRGRRARHVVCAPTRSSRRTAPGRNPAGWRAWRRARLAPPPRLGGRPGGDQKGLAAAVLVLYPGAVPRPGLVGLSRRLATIPSRPCSSVDASTASAWPMKLRGVRQAGPSSSNFSSSSRRAR
jgi:hypothetical protein